MDVTPGVHNAVGEMVRDPRRDGAAAGGDESRRVGLGRETSDYAAYRHPLRQTGWRAKPTTGVARAKPTTGVARVKLTTGVARVKLTTGVARAKPTTGLARATRMSSDASSSSISIFI